MGWWGYFFGFLFRAEEVVRFFGMEGKVCEEKREGLGRESFGLGRGIFLRGKVFLRGKNFRF